MRPSFGLGEPGQQCRASAPAGHHADTRLDQERRETELLGTAVAARDATAERARSIEGELHKVQRRLARIEPAERAQSEEIAGLQREREGLQARLQELTDREDSLRERAAANSDLERERQALEDLLDEAVQDLETKESEIRELQERLKRTARTTSPRSRPADQLARRLRTLYRNLEVDDRALRDLDLLWRLSLANYKTRKRNKRRDSS